MTESATYTVIVTHHPDGEINASFQGVGDSNSDKEAIVYALQEIIKRLEFGESLEIHKH
jgi:hypothetical protein